MRSFTIRYAIIKTMIAHLHVCLLYPCHACLVFIKSTICHTTQSLCQKTFMQYKGIENYSYEKDKHDECILWTTLHWLFVRKCHWQITFIKRLNHYSKAFLLHMKTDYAFHATHTSLFIQLHLQNIIWIFKNISFCGMLISFSKSIKPIYFISGLLPHSC